ncbi:MAG TPA: hypothetical protein H9723_04340 [Candidatus Mediterraneibacter stercoravium]|uniref:Uncharacterized protein n=1 Tax=Candidatus Mediterraneibacter stercoravium TaxID=2838685 RepID=A0A9D2G7C0_9FIRM|nr:hypothetical protein [Candidatus Mediterraneibacter stercoravium]
MKKRILSFLGSMAILVSAFSTSAMNVDASDIDLKKVDGSYLTTEDYSKGVSSDRTRGQHMMDGECSISKAGTKRVYCYGATTANHEVDYLAVIVYVDQYIEEKDAWSQVDWWMVEKENDFFVNTGKSITVDKGYYYRVHADHFVREGDDPIEETFSFTDGILVPKSN